MPVKKPRFNKDLQKTMRRTDRTLNDLLRQLREEIERLEDVSEG